MTDPTGHAFAADAFPELVTAGLLSAVPLDPDHVPYGYNRRTGAVGSSAGRVLGDA